MNLTAAHDLAIHHMTDHGLIADGWTFRFDNAHRRLGQCRADKTITISRFMTADSDQDTVEQTILHEVAHALVGVREGHNAAWKAKAREIGYVGSRTSRNPHWDKVRAQHHTAQAQVASAAGSASAIVKPVPVFRSGQVARIVGGRLNGAQVTVVKQNRTRYRVRAANGDLYDAPFECLSSVDSDGH